MNARFVGFTISVAVHAALAVALVALNRSAKPDVAAPVGSTLSIDIAMFDEAAASAPSVPEAVPTEPEPEPDSEPDLDPKPELGTEPERESEPDLGPEPELEPAPEPDPEPEPVPEPEPESDPGPQPEAELVPEPEQVPESEPEPDSEPEPEPIPEPDTELEPEQVAEPEAVPETEPDDAVPEPTDAVRSSASEAAASAASEAIEDDYKSRLRAAIVAGRSYPRQARRRRQEGTVVVGFRVLADGTIGQLEVRSSSGVGALDEAALAAVRRVGRFEAFPASIDRAALVFSLPITFRAGS